MAPRMIRRFKSRNRRSAKSSQPFFQPAKGEAEHSAVTDTFFTPAPAAVQPKLTIGQPGDKYEKEADTVAERVVNQTTEAPAAAVQRAEMKEEEKVQKADMKEEEKVQKADMKEEEKVQKADMKEEEKVQKAEMKEEEKVQKAEMKEEEKVQKAEMKEEEKVQKAEMKEEEKVQKAEMKEEEKVQKAEMKEEEKVQKAEMKEEEKPAVQAFAPGGGMTVSPAVTARLNQTRGNGSPMPDQTQQEMSGAFGRDFSSVRIHTDNESEELSDSLNAHAFTIGRDIYFNKGKFNPDTREGKHLLAHELTHVQQQGGAEKDIQRKIGDGHDLISPRFKGNTKLEAAFDGETVIKDYTEGAHVRLLQQALVDDGFALPKFGVDGKFGSETAAAVRAYQAKNSLGVDGKVGKQTMGHMDSHFSGGGPGPMPAPPVAVTITGGSDLWWFDGQSPAGYPVQQALTATAPSAGIFTWTVLSGAGFADFSGSPVFVGPTATLKSKNRSLARNDVVVQVQFIGTSGSMGTTTRRFTILAPNSLGFLRNVDKVDATFAYETEIHYNIQDQFGTVLPSNVPINENFTAAPTADFPGMDWRRGPEGGANVNPADWFDQVQGETAGHTPTPVAPTSLLAFLRVYHWPGIWRVGSTTIGAGRRVATVIWQKFKGRARHR